jgi:uncharacterized membrane protein
MGGIRFSPLCGYLIRTMGEAPTFTVPTTSRPRLDGVDAVRGLVMVLMALDHVRDFLQTEPYRATDLNTTTPILFLSRLATHLCAPTFILLAGAGIFLTQRRKTRGQMVWFLVSRGLWLVVLEETIIRLAWNQGFDWTEFQAMVIWVIGWCMVLMSVMVYLPPPAVAAAGMIIVMQHNVLDRITPESAAALWRPLGTVWKLLHAPPVDGIPLWDGAKLNVAYVVIPWFGVMCVGYGLGVILTFEPPRRRFWLTCLGLFAIADFALVRGLNGYGDPRPWAVQYVDFESGQHFDPSEPATNTLAQFGSRAAPPDAVPDRLYTAMSFVNTAKYPPSLDFLLMTLGPALLLLALFDGPLGAWARPLIVFGRVPLFFYVLHLPLIVCCALVVYAWGRQCGWYELDYRAMQKKGLGVPLWGAYLWWLAVLVILYFPCRWYSGVKARSRSAWLSYL